MRKAPGVFSAGVAFALGATWLAASALGAARAPGIEITGRVIDDGGRPIAGAAVALLAYPTRYAVRQAWSGGPDLEERAAATTGKDGRFTLRAPEPGLWLVAARAARHAETLVYVVPLLHRLDLLDIALPKVRPLRVRVEGPDGRPIAGATVLALAGRSASRRPASRSARQRTVLRSQVARTDAEGRAVVEIAEDRGSTLEVVADGFLPAGKEHRAGAKTVIALEAAENRVIEVKNPAGKAVANVLLVLDDRSPPIAKTDQAGRATVAVPAGAALAKRPLTVHAYAPDGSDGTVMMDPAEGEEARKPVRLSLTVPQNVRGTVIDSLRREPIAGALVWSAGSDQISTRSDGRGEFLLRVPRAVSWLSAGAEGFLISGSRTVEARPTTVVLAPAGRLPGRVVDARGEPVADVVLQVSSSVATGRQQQGSATATTDDKGGFELSPVPTDVGLTVLAKRKGFAPAEVESMVAADGEIALLEITLLAGRRAQGMVVDDTDQPLVGVTVTLAQTPAGQRAMYAFMRMRERAFLAATTDREGRFRFEDLGPGRFVLRAVHKGFAPVSVPGITVEAGDDVADFGTVVMLDGAVLEGLVVEPDGTPIAEAMITVSERAGGMRFLTLRQEPPKVTSGADGRFSLADLRPDAPVEIRVSAEGHAATHVANVMVPTQEPVRIQMNAGIDLRGVVVDAQGSGVENAMVMAIFSGSIGRQRRMARVSDGEGTFLLESLQPGDWSLTASAAGFQSREVPKVTVTAGESPRPARIQLETGASLVGRVTGADGTAVVDAYVALRRTARDQMRSFRDHGVTTDGDGQYRLRGLPSGRQAISFSHARHQSLVRDVEIGTAEQHLDVTLEAGLEIAGRVVDPNGAPVAGALVSVSSAATSARRRFYSGGSNVRETDTEGNFRIEGLGPGDFFVSAARAGYASVATEEPIALVATSVEGIELRFTAGGKVLGTVRGVAFDDLAAVSVMAMRSDGRSSTQPQVASVDHEGRFELANLSVGDWQIYASVGRRSETKQINLPAVGAEVRVDLDFGSGFTLTGTVLEGGAPVPGLSVDAHGIDTQSAAQETTSPQGRFTLRGLEAGRYELSVGRGGRLSRPLARRELDVHGDDDIVIEVSLVAVTGRVFEASGSLPISGAAIQVTLNDDRRLTVFSPWRGRDAVSGDDGVFSIAEMAPGSYRLHVEKEGFAATLLVLEVAAAVPPAPVDVSMERAAGLRLEVLLPSGLPPRDVTVAALDQAGQAFSVGNHVADASGTIEVDQVPAGRWTLLVGGAGSATARIEAQVPGPPIQVVLPPVGRLLVRVPEARDGGRPYVSLDDAQGKVRIISPYGVLSERWVVSGGTATIAPLPPGPLQVTVAMPDGSKLRGTVAVLANQIVTLEIR